MPDAPVLGGSEKVKLDADAFGAAFNNALVHESVRAELNARRRGTHSTKTRGQVRGGGAKPWRQKGTGRARAGSSRSPIWAGGGTVFGPQPRHYTFKVNRKERRAALRSALSVHAERDSLAVFDATKTRGNVRGGGAKPWRQKGTGRARAGSSRSPIWAGGGVVFGPQPRHYTFKVNRKERRAALRSALSVHAERETLAVFDAAKGFDTPSTKAAAKLLGDWLGNGRGSVLVVLGDAEEQVALSFRNLDRVSVLPATGTGVADVIGASALLLSQAAADALTDRAKGGA
jgi:large subunit ribosomal protein L4